MAMIVVNFCLPQGMTCEVLDNTSDIESEAPSTNEDDRIEVLVAADEERVESNSTASKSGNDDWILDSGCSYHMCPKRVWLVEYKP